MMVDITAAWKLTSGLVPEREDGRSTFTMAEFDRQEFPPCPKCGTRLEYEPLHCPDLESRDKYMPKRVHCPRRCDLSDVG